MKILLLILLAQHAVISARAGYITFSRGLTNVVEGQDHIGEGQQIRSQRGSRFEAALGPDSYVRLRGQAAILLESEDLSDPAVRLLNGAMLVDADNIDDDIPIRLLLDDLTFRVRKDGLYLVERNRVTVLDGELDVEDPSGRIPDARLRKDWALGLADDGTFSLTELSDTDDFDRMPLVQWSHQRAEQLEPRPVFRRRSSRRSIF